jgi:hypothetical protein
MKRLLPLFLCLPVLLLVSCKSMSQTDVLIGELDETLSRSKVYQGYFKQRVKSIRSLKSASAGDVRNYEINSRLVEEFSVWSLDSTIFYLQQNINLGRRRGDAVMVGSSEIRLAKAYVMAGYHAEAGEILRSYSSKPLPEALKPLYFDAMHTLSGELMAYARTTGIWSQRLQERDYWRDSLLAYTEEGSYEWFKLMREEAYSRNDDSLTLSLTEKMLAIAPQNSKEYAEACFLRSYSASDQDERIEWLCRSAMADAMCAIRDYASLIDLSVILFERGDVNRSFHYMADHCMPDAIAFGGKLRPWQIVRFFPEVEKAYEAESNLHNRRQIVLTIVISALLVLLALVLVALIIRQKALDRARRCLEQSYRELKESDNVKQTYIAGFLEHLSENINTSRQYKNHVRKFLRMGYIKDLEEEIDELPPIEEDIEGFYKIFDETFINLCPGFVEKFNALLLPEEAIIPKAGCLLTPELRVFALIKLGISDSSRIASLLHYSSNTIYNYRAKIKNKAIGDRDSFEDAVKAIN